MNSATYIIYINILKKNISASVSTVSSNEYMVKFNLGQGKVQCIMIAPKGSIWEDIVYY